MRRVIESDLRTEAAITDTGPVADLAVTDTHQVGEPVAAHVGEEDGLRAVRKDESRALFLLECPMHALGRAVAPARFAWVPGEGFVFSQQRVGMAVAGEIQEPQVGVIPVDVRQRRKGDELAPEALPVSIVEAGGHGLQAHQFEHAIAVDVHQLRGARRVRGERRKFMHDGARSEAAVAQVRLVVPGARLLTQHAGQALAVEVDPLIAWAPRADGQVLELIRFDEAQRAVDHRLAVRELSGGI